MGWTTDGGDSGGGGSGWNFASGGTGNTWKPWTIHGTGIPYNTFGYFYGVTTDPGSHAHLYSGGVAGASSSYVGVAFQAPGYAESNYLVFVTDNGNFVITGSNYTGLVTGTLNANVVGANYTGFGHAFDGMKMSYAMDQFADMALAAGVTDVGTSYGAGAAVMGAAYSVLTTAADIWRTTAGW